MSRLRGGPKRTLRYFLRKAHCAIRGHRDVVAFDYGPYRVARCVYCQGRAVREFFRTMRCYLDGHQNIRSIYYDGVEERFCGYCDSGWL